MLRHFRSAALPAAMVLLQPVHAAESGLPLGDRQACMQGPVAQFGRYIGAWNIEDWRLSQDGQEWTAGAGARWDFFCIGNGVAVQDFWMPNGGGVGTNLRSYNAETEAWEVVWAVGTQPGLVHIEAKQQASGAILMHVKSPIPDPLRRITFFPPEGNGWNWQLEFSWDQGENWTEVYRIKATPRQP